MDVIGYWVHADWHQEVSLGIYCALRESHQRTKRHHPLSHTSLPLPSSHGESVINIIDSFRIEHKVE
jgi:hypothetical protein